MNIFRQLIFLPVSASIVFTYALPILSEDFPSEIKKSPNTSTIQVSDDDEVETSTANKRGEIFLNIIKSTDPVLRSLDELDTDVKVLRKDYEAATKPIIQTLNKLNESIRMKHAGTEDRLNALTKRIETMEEINANRTSFEINLLRVRYEAGVDIIKGLYSKTIDLKAYYSGIALHNDFTDIANPLAYDDFRNNIELIRKSVNKIYKIELPESLLKANPTISMPYAVVYGILSKLKKKNEIFMKMIKILDVTGNIRNDFQITNNERIYLTEKVGQLEEECRELFKDYTSVVGYSISLDESRKDKLGDPLSDNIKETFDKIKMESTMRIKTDPLFESSQEVDAKFMMGKLVLLMGKYNSLMDQCDDYFRKMRKIVSNYDSESRVNPKLS